MARGRSSRSPSIGIVAVVGLAAVVLVVVAAAVISALGSNASSTNARRQVAAMRYDRASLLAWEARVVPLVQQGGQVVEDGMKPAINDLLYQHVTPPAFIVHEAQAWAQALTRVRTQLAALTPPSSMQSATGFLDRAMAGYVSAAHAFRRAAASPAGHVRRHFVRVGRHRGVAADALYDNAAALIQRERHRVGLPTDVNFPSGNA